MKFIGMLMLTSCTTLIGINASLKIKEKSNICEQLISFCDFILIDFKSNLTPIIVLMDKLLKSERFSLLQFMSTDNVIYKLNVSSPLSLEENERITELLYSLGKSDINTQISIIKSFQEYIRISYKNYNEKYNKYKKLYSSVGFFFGLCIAIIFA